MISALETKGSRSVSAESNIIQDLSNRYSISSLNAFVIRGQNDAGDKSLNGRTFKLEATIRLSGHCVMTSAEILSTRPG